MLFLFFFVEEGEHEEDEENDPQHRELCANCGTALGIDVPIECLWKNRWTEQEENETWCSQCYADHRTELKEDGWGRDSGEESSEEEEEEEDQAPATVVPVPVYQGIFPHILKKLFYLHTLPFSLYSITVSLFFLTLSCFLFFSVGDGYPDSSYRSSAPVVRTHECTDNCRGKLHFTFKGKLKIWAEDRKFGCCKCECYDYPEFEGCSVCPICKSTNVCGHEYEFPSLLCFECEHQEDEEEEEGV
jgi:hypothetical protein